MKEKKWIIHEYEEEKVSRLSRALGVLPVTAKLLLKRNVSDPAAAKGFLNKDIEGFHSPFLFQDMKKGAERILETVREQGEILIWGDYDVDGVTATTVLLKYLISIGGKTRFHIPERIGEGYGLNKETIESFARGGGSLLITVDSGITAVEEIAFANSLGLRVIVTDHHECRNILPAADAVINPKRVGCVYPYKELAGVGVVFKLLCALEMIKTGQPLLDCLPGLLEEYSDLVAMGTIADVMPIADENRLIVHHGLEKINLTQNIGLQALIRIAGVDKKSNKKRKISSATVGFVLAPRINAAGRMDSSRIAVDLFMTKEEQVAADIAFRLNEINRERQVLETQILQSAIEKIEREHDFEKDKVIVICDDAWHHGIIGIVASRITEKYNLPSILISFQNEGQADGGSLGKGSARSIKGLNMIEALTECSGDLLKYGGHELAAGLSIRREQLEQFRQNVNRYAEASLRGRDLEKSIDVDCEIHVSDVSLQTVDEINLLEPFGLANPAPLFYLENLVISDIVSIGEEKHTKLILQKDSVCLTALSFGTPANSLPFCIFDKIDVVCNMDVNHFKNQQNVQIILRDLRLSQSIAEYIRYKTEQFLLFKQNSLLPMDDALVPSREDFKMVYLCVSRLLQSGAPEDPQFPKCVELSYVCRYLSYVLAKRFDLHKLFLIMEIFYERKVFMGEYDTERPTFHFISPGALCEPGYKTCLENSPLLKRLKERTKF